MFKALLFIVLLCSSVKTFSQASDFITVKKRNNRTLKTFFPGVPITFQTYDKRQASGLIIAIRNDSVFLKNWDIRPGYNSLGIPVTDTLGVYLSGYHYKEIDKVDVSERMHFQQLTPGRILIIGGTGYALLNVINGAYLHEPITSSKNLTSLGIAAGAVGMGFLTNYLIKHSNKYHVEYVRMNEVKKQLRGL
ncbi:MAG: hypothetical protein ABIQ88_05245 [Chitinophagaceae bacterium]